MFGCCVFFADVRKIVASGELEMFWDIMTQRNILGDLSVQHCRVNFKSRNELSVLLAKCLVLEDAEQFQLILVFEGRCRH